MTGFDIKRYDPVISEIIGKNTDNKYDSERCLDLCKSNALLFTNAKEMCNIMGFTSFKDFTTEVSEDVIMANKVRLTELSREILVESKKRIQSNEAIPN